MCRHYNHSTNYTLRRLLKTIAHIYLRGILIFLCAVLCTYVVPVFHFYSTLKDFFRYVWLGNTERECRKMCVCVYISHLSTTHSMCAGIKICTSKKRATYSQCEHADWMLLVQFPTTVSACLVLFFCIHCFFLLGTKPSRLEIPLCHCSWCINLKSNMRKYVRFFRSFVQPLWAVWFFLFWIGHATNWPLHIPIHRISSWTMVHPHKGHTKLWFCLSAINMLVVFSFCSVSLSLSLCLPHQLQVHTAYMLAHTGQEKLKLK